MTAEEVAERFRVTTSTVTRWAREGKLAHFRTPGGALRFQRTDVDAFLPTEGAT